jgi:hypothetical protein
MKKTFQILFLVFLSLSGVAQQLKDKIITLKGDTIKCQITLVNENYVFYNTKHYTGKYLVISKVKKYLLADSSKPTIIAKTDSINKADSAKKYFVIKNHAVAQEKKDTIAKDEIKCSVGILGGGTYMLNPYDEHNKHDYIVWIAGGNSKYKSEVKYNTGVSLKLNISPHNRLSSETVYQMLGFCANANPYGTNYKTFIRFSFWSTSFLYERIFGRKKLTAFLGIGPELNILSYNIYETPYNMPNPHRIQLFRNGSTYVSAITHLGIDYKISNKLNIQMQAIVSYMFDYLEINFPPKADGLKYSIGYYSKLNIGVFYSF